MHVMRVTEPFMLLLLTTLGALSFSLHSDGLAVVAADPLGPDYVHADLDSATHLQCPGILRSPTKVTAVRWFAGNTSGVSVQQDARTSIDSAGRLVIRITEQRDHGWYHCEYASSGSIVAGSVHLAIVEISLDIYVIDPTGSTPKSHTSTDWQGTNISLHQNMVVIIDAKSSLGDGLRIRNPYWLYNGENSAIRRPFFCYPGYITQNGDEQLRMVMLSTQANYSGRWEFIAGGLRTYINFSITGNGSAVKLLTSAEVNSFSCDDQFSPMLVTHPPSTTTTTTSLATPPAVTSSPKTSGDPTAARSLPAATTSSRVNESDGNDGTGVPVAVYTGIGGGVLLCICIVVVLYYFKRRATLRPEHDKERVPRLSSEPPPRPIVGSNSNSARNHVYDQPIAQPKALQYAFPARRDPTAAAPAERAAAELAQSHLQDGWDYDSYAMLVSATSPPVSCGIRSLSYQNSRDSLDSASLSMPSPTFRVGAKAATLAHMPTSSQSFDSGSLSEMYSTLVPGAKLPYGTSGSFERTRSARLHSPAFGALSDSVQNSCPMHRRSSDASPRSTSRLMVDRADSPANIVLPPDGSPLVAHSRRRCSASALSRGSTVAMSPLLMTIKLQHADSRDSFRGSANIVISVDNDSGSSPDSPGRSASNSISSRVVLVTDA